MSSGKFLSVLPGWFLSPRGISRLGLFHHRLVSSFCGTSCKQNHAVDYSFSYLLVLSFFCCCCWLTLVSCRREFRSKGVPDVFNHPRCTNICV